MNDEKRLTMVRNIFKNMGVLQSVKQTDMIKIAALLKEAGIAEARVATGSGIFSLSRFSNLTMDELTTLQDISKNNWPPRSSFVSGGFVIKTTLKCG